MTSASLPSTLVKCLYLFFDLPPIPPEDKEKTEEEFTEKERRILLQKMFIQVGEGIMFFLISMMPKNRIW